MLDYSRLDSEAYWTGFINGWSFRLQGPPDRFYLGSSAPTHYVRGWCAGRKAARAVFVGAVILALTGLAVATFLFLKLI